MMLFRSRWILGSAAVVLGACGDSAESGADGATPTEVPGTPASGGSAGGPTASAGSVEGSAASTDAGADAAAPTTGGGPAADAAGGASGIPASAGQGGQPGPDAPILENPWGFPLRQPEIRTLDCSVKMVDDLPAQQVADADQICTFSYEGVTGHIYLEATVVDCEYYYALVGYFSSRAWLSVDGVVIPLEDPLYTLNGDHFTDSLSFTHAGRDYQYWHSSFAMYYRSCQPMDCMRVFDGATGVHDATTILEDGCTTDRTLPVVCVAVRPDGTVPPLQDAFAPCPGSEDWLSTPLAEP